jgi:hypothetical protein
MVVSVLGKGTLKVSGMVLETISAPIEKRILRLQNSFENKYNKIFSESDRKIKLMVGVGNEDSSQDVFRTLNWVKSFAEKHQEVISIIPYRCWQRKAFNCKLFTLSNGLRLINKP